MPTTTTPPSVRSALHHHPLFPLADQQAVAVLAAAVTNRADWTGSLDTDGALYALLRETVYYRNARKEKTINADGWLVDVEGAGDLINGCFEAGLLLGLAFGLRLRGTA